MTRTAILCLLLGSSGAAATPAVTPPAAADEAAALTRAAQAYESGRLADALAGYAALAERYPGDAAIAYNLGNTHWRLGKRGQAIRWYERARRLDPRDGDIRFNLRLARSSLADEEAGWGETFDRVLTPGELRWIVVGLLWAICLTGGTALIREWPWARWRGTVTFGVPALIVAAVWFGLRAHDLARPWAVVSVPTAEVRSGPGDQFPVGYTAPEGQRALILNRRPGWVEIGIPSKSLKGWVSETAIEKI